MMNLTKNSIAFKLSFIKLIIIILVAIILISSIAASGVINTLKKNSYISFSKNTETHKSFMKDQMILGFGNILSFAYDISEIHDDIAASNGELADENISLFLQKSAPIVVDMLNSSFITGAFLILDNNNGKDQYSALYLKDNDPMVIHELHGDISILKAPAEVANIFSPPLDFHTKWTQNITLSDDNRELLDIPIQRAKESIYIRDSGCWTVFTDFGNDENLVLTYSIPLTDKNGNTFGILGMGATDEYFYHMLPRSTFVEDGTIGYILAIVDSDTQEIIPILNYGDIQNTIAPLGIPLNLNSVDKTLELYEIENIDADFPILASLYQLELYEDTPFDDEQWIFIGLADKDKLEESSTNFITTLVIIFYSIVIGCGFFAFLLEQKFAKPITTLASKVKINNIETILSLSKTKSGYAEVDVLADAIAQFSRKEKEAILKTDNIIRMLPLGTFEYNKDSDFVICSEIFLKLIDLPAKENTIVDSKLFFQRINEIKENVEDEQNNIYMLKDITSKWVKIVSIDHGNTIFGICMDVTKEILDNHAIKFERDYDILTKLFNRSAFRRSVENLLQKGISNVSAFVMFDLDNLKYINDTYGHDIGDIYLRTVANVLADVLREGCILGRMSGDEFYVFLYGFKTKEDIKNILAAVYESFEENQILLPNGNTYKPRMSGGIAWYEQDSYVLDELIRFADFAMYQGKHTTKGEIREFDKAFYENESFMLNGNEELNNVLDNQLVDYVFQPIISAKTGEIYGYEALMRPRSEVLNSPIKLIQLATVQSLLWKIEQITFFKTLAFYKENMELFNNCKIFINSIANECLSDEDFSDLNSQYSDVMKNVVVEVIENEKLNSEILERKRKLIKGVNALMALDDYGVGYNGDISMLSLKPNIVKIDRLMITDIETDKNRQSIVQKLLVYAKEQGILVLAEGVETFSQMEYLMQAGVDFLQGYYISRPIPIPNYNTNAITKEIKDIQNRFKTA